jgi:molecular chaperone DnaK
VLLLDVTPLSLGIETEGGIMTVMVERNTTIPKTHTQIFSTAANNQPAVDIQVYQGERRMARDNRLLGKFTLDGIPPAPRGMPQVEVTFSIDANGILEVKARDKATGKEQQIKVQGSSGMSKEDIARMVDEAKANADSDQKKEELAKARNQAEHLAHQMRSMMDEHKDKFQGDEAKEITAAIEKVERMKTCENIVEIQDAIKELETKSSAWGKRIHEAAFQQQQAAGAAGAAGGPGGPGGPGPQPGSGPQGAGKGDDNIKDADFTVQK